ncbi:acyltransferase family protein [Halomonas sp. C05BenzN]|uniref:acyltransferase family protein n=1 Tax=Halomonas sp. C05BenzN TaxID=3411041 RepID=UPI003B92F49E
MQRIEEIYWLRAYGCLAVFSFHLLDHFNQRLDNLATDLARIPTVLGTPIFIFISIFLFSMRYGRDIPPGFLGSRVKHVLVPYLVYGLAYSAAEFLRLRAEGAEDGLFETLREYLIYAGWHGYFLIIAAQFYAFYWLYGRLDLARWLPATSWLAIGSLVSMAWWGYWQWRSTLPPGYLHWIAPLGWLYLFFLALVLVRHYHDRPESRPTWLVALARPRWLLALVGLVLLLSLPGWLEYSSKEMWVVPLFLLFTLWVMGRLRGRPAPLLVRRLNEYSFGIYLAHPMFFNLVDVLDPGQRLPPGLYLLALVVVGLAGSIAWNRAANRLEWGGLLFGKRLRVA